jgi:hypothetical protein
MGAGEPVELRSAGKRDTSTRFAEARLFVSSSSPAARKPSKPPGCRSRRRRRSWPVDMPDPSFPGRVNWKGTAGKTFLRGSEAATQRRR